MRIDHAAIFVADLEKARDFFLKYFSGTSNNGYHNEKTGFRSYFISFDDGSRLEIMNKPGIADPKKEPTAVKYDTIRYEEVLAQRLAVMDSTATSLAMDNDLPVVVFALADPENILRVLQGEAIGTFVN